MSINTMTMLVIKDCNDCPCYYSEYDDDTEVKVFSYCGLLKKLEKPHYLGYDNLHVIDDNETIEVICPLDEGTITLKK